MPVQPRRPQDIYNLFHGHKYHFEKETGEKKGPTVECRGQKSATEYS